MGLLAAILPRGVIRWLSLGLRGTASDRFARVFHASPDWIVITRLTDSLIVEANQGFEDLSGYSAREAIGQPMSKFNIWVNPQKRTDIIEQLKKDGVVRNVQTQARRRDGAVRDLDVSVTLISVDDKANSHAVWICRDITAARLPVESLRDSESRFSMLFALSPVPMCYSNAANKFSITQWNDAWFATFGFDPKACQGKTGSELNIWVKPQDRQDILDMVATGKPKSQMETLMRRADGVIRHVSVATRLLMESENPLLISTYIDITEREESRLKIETLNAELESRVMERTAELITTNLELSQTLEALQLAKDQLVQSEKLAALGALVAGVSHELNTPIGNGLTVASTLEHRVEEFAQKIEGGLRRSDLQSFVEEARFAAEVITRNLSRAGQLVSSFKQVAVDQTSSQRRVFSLHSLVSEIVLTLSAEWKRYTCVVVAQVPANLLLESYPGPLGQVLSNLISNALIHGFEVKDAGSITISAAPGTNDTVHLSVRDTGKGIAAEILNRIFEPFFTTRLGQGGSGLGLHIVHNIVGGVLGGQIKVVSEPGGVTEFSLVLPREAPQHLAEMGALPPSATPEDRRLAGRGATTLIRR